MENTTNEVNIAGIDLRLLLGDGLRDAFDPKLKN